MPFGTIKWGDKIANITLNTGKVHGTFPDTREGHIRAGAQLKHLTDSLKTEAKPRKVKR